MSRKNIINAIADAPLNHTKETHRIAFLFSESSAMTYDSYRRPISFTFENAAEVEFHTYKFRGRCVSLADYKQELGITREQLSKNVSLETMLIYFEFVLNMVKLVIDSTYKSYLADIEKLIKDNITNALDNMNYEIICSDGALIIVSKNAAADALVEYLPEIRDELFEYNRVLLKGKMQRKREILCKLYNKVEPIRPKLKQHNYTIESDVGELCNSLNIRHNNVDEGKMKIAYVAQMSDEELEPWFDTTYDILLTCLQLGRYIERKPDIKFLKSKINTKPGT